MNDTKYDAKKVQDDNFKLSRPGAFTADQDGVITPLNDFQRGMHFQKFKDVKAKRKACGVRHSNDWIHRK